MYHLGNGIFFFIFRQNQQVLIESVQQENGKFADCKEMEELNRHVRELLSANLYKWRSRSVNYIPH